MTADRDMRQRYDARQRLLDRVRRIQGCDDGDILDVEDLLDAAIRHAVLDAYEIAAGINVLLGHLRRVGVPELIQARWDRKVHGRAPRDESRGRKRKEPR